MKKNLPMKKKSLFKKAVKYTIISHIYKSLK